MLFDPPARDGTILLQIEDLLAGRQLILQCPKGRPLPLAVSAEYAVSVLSNGVCIGPNGSGKEDPALQPIDPESKYLKGLYKVTVKLVPSVHAAGLNTERAKAVATVANTVVTVKYMATVYPPLDTKVLPPPDMDANK